jgi:hypothetical protein
MLSHLRCRQQRGRWLAQLFSRADPAATEALPASQALRGLAAVLNSLLTTVAGISTAQRRRPEQTDS